jgi:hypothetical protein
MKNIIYMDKPSSISGKKFIGIIVCVTIANWSEGLSQIGRMNIL